MERPRTLVIRTAGTNCDQEMVRAFELVGSSVDLVHLDAIIREPERVASYDAIGFPGGFSYGDDIAAGRVFAAKVRERLAGPLREAADRGVPMIGVCNGFQVLVQTGLLPGIEGVHAALVENSGGRFIDDWVGIEAPDSSCVWTTGLAGSDRVMRLPLASGEGRFVADYASLAALEESGCVALLYADNLNGSAGSIAGICDPTGRIFGLMPHPDRYLEWRHHPAWTRLEKTETDGEPIGSTIFRNGIEASRTVRA